MGAMARTRITVLPEALRAWRKVADVTQHQLGKEADCSDTLIALIEIGRRQPSEDTASRIADALTSRLGFPLPVEAFAVVEGGPEELAS